MNHYRADVVGSMLRPEGLLLARAEHKAGRLTHADFKRVEDRAVDDCVAIQERAGVHVLTDGEMRRGVFADQLAQATDGFEVVRDNSVDWFTLDGRIEKSPVTMGVVSRLKRKRHLSSEEYSYLRAATDRPIKMTIPSPTMYAYYWVPGASDAAYSSTAAYMADVTDILRDEVVELVRLGATYIQFDAPEFGMLLDPHQQRWFAAKGFAVDRMVRDGVEMINAIVAGHPGIVFGLHICRGNNATRYMAKGSYAAIAQEAFEHSHVHRLLLEYDDERSGDFEPLKNVPDDKLIVLGLLTTKWPRLETAQDVKARIEEASRYVDLERLALSTQCGFASVAKGNAISADVQEQKLPSGRGSGRVRLALVTAGTRRTPLTISTPGLCERRHSGGEKPDASDVWSFRLARSCRASVCERLVPARKVAQDSVARHASVVQHDSLPLAVAGVGAQQIERPTVAPPGREEIYRRAWEIPSLIKGGAIAPRWMADGNSFWYAEGAPDNTVIYKFDPVTRMKTPLFDTARLRQALTPVVGHELPYRGLPFETFTFLDQERSVKFAVDGDEYVMPLATYAITRLTAALATGASALGPRIVRYGTPSVTAAPARTSGHGRPDTLEMLSPDGRWLLGEKDFNLYVRSTYDGREVPLTTDGVQYVEWRIGSLDNNRSSTAKWSRDSSRIGVLKRDDREVWKIPVLNQLKQNDEVFFFPRAKAGGRFPLTELYVIDVQIGREGQGAAARMIPIGIW